MAAVLARNRCTIYLLFEGARKSPFFFLKGIARINDFFARRVMGAGRMRNRTLAQSLPMKARTALLALSVFFVHDALAASSPFFIYFNAEDASHCSVSGVTNASLLPDGNLLALTNANPPTLSAACGTTSSGTTPTASLTISPTTVDASVPQSAILTWKANNVNSCTITGTDATVSAEFSNAWTNAAVACGGTPNHCAGGTNTVTLTPIAAGTNGTYNFGLQCSSGSSGAYAATTLAVTGSTGGGSGGVACTTGTTGDVPGFTALCSGNMTLYKPGASQLGPSPYTFPFVFGSDWPGSNFGYAMTFDLGNAQFLSIPFTPTPGHTISFVENNTYTHYPVTFSVSTSPGLFNNSAKGNGVLCVKSGNPNLSMSSNGTTANCTLNENTQYWFNVIMATYSGSTWVKKCPGSSCSVGFNETSTN